MMHREVGVRGKSFVQQSTGSLVVHAPGGGDGFDCDDDDDDSDSDGDDGDDSDDDVWCREF